jgi:methyl-accepting chemotaxis protein
MFKKSISLILVPVIFLLIGHLLNNFLFSNAFLVTFIIDIIAIKIGFLLFYQQFSPALSSFTDFSNKYQASANRVNLHFRFDNAKSTVFKEFITQLNHQSEQTESRLKEICNSSSRLIPMSQDLKDAYIPKLLEDAGISQLRGGHIQGMKLKV